MNKKTILALLCFTIAIIGILSPVNAAVETVNSEDKTYTIESKEKTAKIKLTWNGNGGTIGGKKTITTSIDKGKKIAKIPITPKRTGYTFKGWYTKKSGGSKISANTKVNKKTTYFAQWTKTKKGNTQYNNADSVKKMLIGRWVTSGGYYENNFYADGKFKSKYTSSTSVSTSTVTGNYKITKVAPYGSDRLRSVDITATNRVEIWEDSKGYKSEKKLVDYRGGLIFDINKPNEATFDYFGEDGASAGESMRMIKK